MQSSKRLISAIVVATLSATSALLIHLDTRAYRNVLSKLPEVVTIAALQQEAKALSEDIDLFASCSAHLRKASAETHLPVRPARDCLLASLPTLKTQEGVTTFALAAGMWLEANPHDEAVRKVALQAIEIGWKDYEKQLPHYELLDEIAAAHDDSIILRALHGNYTNGSYASLRAEQLEKAEWRILLPDTVRRQGERRMALYLKAEKHEGNPS